MAAVPAAARAAIRAVVDAAASSPTGSSPVWAGDLDPVDDAPLVAVAAGRVAALGRPPRPHDLGTVYESLLDADARDAGAHFTAPDVARRLVDRAAPSSWLAAAERRVWDPACGGGAFLLAAADALAHAGHEPTAIVEDLVWGTDVDAGAVAVCRAALRWWAEERGVVADPADHVRTADTLLDPDATVGGPFDLVVGNPPFQGQLAGATVRDRRVAGALQARWGDVVVAYTDTAAVFLVAGARAVAPGGRLALVLPLSTLAARDAAPARRAVEEIAELTGLWVAGEPVFDADVEVCAPVLRRRPAAPGAPTADRDAPIADRDASIAEGDASIAEGDASTVDVEHGTGEPPPVARWRGRSFTPLGGSGRRRPDATTVSELAALGADAGSWAVHALAALDVPDPLVRTDGTLGDLVRTAAGFRDEYYGLVGHVVEGPPGVGPDDRHWPEHLAALVTSGSIDVGRLTWGERDSRFAGDRFVRPVVDRTGLADGSRASAWAAATAVAKVVVATQTRVGEAAVDARGTVLPSTPVVVAHAPPERLWEVAAVICSPVGSVAASARTAGTGRSAQAVRHTTASVRGLPIPVDGAAWRSGAAALRAGDRDAFLDAMAAAFAVGGPDAERLAEWWIPRAPWPSPAHQDPHPDETA